MHCEVLLDLKLDRHSTENFYDSLINLLNKTTIKLNKEYTRFLNEKCSCSSNKFKMQNIEMVMQFSLQFETTNLDAKQCFAR